MTKPSILALLVLIICGCSPSSKNTVEQSAPGESVAEPNELNSTDSGIQVADGVSYALESAEQRHNEFPETFWIPPRAQRESLQVDDLVKLLFQITVDGESHSERMWVNIQEITDDGYLGILDNDPFCTDKMKHGIKVQFGPQHVIDIYE